ncbi:MAG: CBS domain-containing protein [Rhodobacteraceae bacterium]|nr:CBS domain-containing protein [Paracoccaceae bacterium]
MLVQQILKGKPSQEIATIKSSATVSQAAQLLAEKRIGALVVSDDGTSVAGMFSERDIVRELGNRGVGCMSACIRDYMTTDISTCAKSDNADQVLQQMTTGRFRHLPVMEDGKMIGLISIGDVVLARLSEMAMENQALEGMIKGF